MTIAIVTLALAAVVGGMLALRRRSPRRVRYFRRVLASQAGECEREGWMATTPPQPWGLARGLDEHDLLVELDSRPVRRRLRHLIKRLDRVLAAYARRRPG